MRRYASPLLALVLCLPAAYPHLPPITSPASLGAPTAGTFALRPAVYTPGWAAPSALSADAEAPLPAPPPPDDDTPTSDASQQPQDRPEELEGAEGAGDAIAQETADAVQAVQQSGQEEVVRDVPTLIADAANRWGLDPQTMLRIAWCESRWDPNARGPGGAAGVFQIVPQTWSWASAAAGMGGASPFDAAANVETASWLMKAHGPREWSCR